MPAVMPRNWTEQIPARTDATRATAIGPGATTTTGFGCETRHRRSGRFFPGRPEVRSRGLGANDFVEAFENTGNIINGRTSEPASNALCRDSAAQKSVEIGAEIREIGAR